MAFRSKDYAFRPTTMSAAFERAGLMAFRSKDYAFRPTTMSDAFQRAGLVDALVAIGMTKGPHLVREKLVERGNGETS